MGSLTSMGREHMQKNGLNLPGISNAREIGGFPVGTNRVKQGLLIRTGALSACTPQAICTLKEEYRVQAIVDFRMSGERLKNPDPEMPGTKNYSFPVVEIEDYIVALGNPELAKQYLSREMDRETMVRMAIENGLIGPETYRLFLLGERGVKAYKGFFKVLLEADPKDGAILWHCTDGKDRAGLASALVLAALGASKETIFEDYLLTNEYYAAQLAKVREKYAGASLEEEKMEALLFVAGGAVKKYLEKAFEALEQQYGGVEGYLVEAMGLKNDDLELLRTKYTCGNVGP